VHRGSRDTWTFPAEVKVAFNLKPGASELSTPLA
jgi:hypothetical protein